MAIILIGLIAVGVQPGASMLTTQRPLMFSMLWTLVIANLMATALAMAFAKPFSKACLVPYYDLIPAVLLFCIVGVFSVTYEMNDLIAFLIFSVVGVFMKRHGWPRAPLMVAVVLGPQVQQYLWLSTDRYGWEWLLHWDVILLGTFLLATVLWPMYRNRRDKRTAMDMDIVSDARRPTEIGSMAMCGVLIAMFTYMVAEATQWPLRASISVYFIAALGTLFALLQIARDTVALRRIKDGAIAVVPFTGIEIRREFEFALWVAGMVAAIALVGFHIAFFLFPLAYSQVYGTGWRRGLTTAICGVALLWFIFDFMNGVVWPDPLLLPFLYN
jgi:hypothetical protein